MLHRSPSDGFLNQVDKSYMRIYHIEHFVELLHKEITQVNLVCDSNKEFECKFGERRHRAYLIDRLFGDASLPQMNMTDKSILY